MNDEYISGPEQTLLSKVRDRLNQLIKRAEEMGEIEDNQQARLAWLVLEEATKLQALEAGMLLGLAGVSPEDLYDLSKAAQQRLCERFAAVGPLDTPF